MVAVVVGTQVVQEPVVKDLVAVAMVITKVAVAVELADMVVTQQLTQTTTTDQALLMMCQVKVMDLVHMVF